MAQVNIRIDDALKESAEKLFEELGLNMTTAVNIFVRQTVREGGIPFTITTHVDPFYSDSNMTMLRKSVKEIEEGKIVTKTMEELMAMEK
jgi:DNA-damage-inducible protein J